MIKKGKDWIQNEYQNAMKIASVQIRKAATLKINLKKYKVRVKLYSCVI